MLVEDAIIYFYSLPDICTKTSFLSRIYEEYPFLKNWFKEVFPMLSWRKIILCLLILSFLIGISGCQAGKIVDKTADSIRAIPDRIGQAIVSIVDGIKNIGDALADQVSNIVKGMTDR
jgi:hypothetical protein